MKSKQKISSETELLYIILKELITFPYNLFRVLFVKEKPGILLNPFFHIHEFIRQAKFTYAIILTNFIAFIFSGFLSENALLNLANSPSNMFSGNLHSLITSGFLHANFTHFIGNMIFIFIFGRIVERKLGYKKSAFIYFGALIISAVFSNLIYFFNGVNVLGIGASGALMGLVSTAILLDPFYLTYFFLIPVPVMFVGWMAIYGDILGILSPTQTNIGYFAHFGGFISIGLLVYLLNSNERKKMKKGVIINLISLLIWLFIMFFII